LVHVQSEAAIIRVLLVEDDPAEMRVLQDALSETPEVRFELSCAQRLGAALGNLQASGADVILLDLGLADVDGIAAVRSLYAAAPSVPIIVLTGEEERLMPLRAMQQGAQDYLVKSQLGPELLVRSIRYSIERKRAELVLRQSEHRFRDMADTSPVMLWIADATAAFMFVNKQWLDFTGRSLEQELGAGWLEDLHPADRDRFDRVFKGAFSERQSFRAEARFRRSDGEYRWLLDSGVPHLGPDGVFAGYIGSCVDITELKVAQEQQETLQRQIERAAREWTFTFDAVDLPIVVLQFDGRIRRLNRAAKELAQRDFQKLIGLPIGDLGPGEPWRTAAQFAASFPRSGETIVRQVRDEATGRTWDLSMRYFYDTIADEPRITLVARDISPIVHLQETLRRTEMMSALGSLVGGVAHQIRNPLFSLTATLDAFEARFPDRDEYRRYVTTMRSELNRLSQLTQDLLAYGKPPQYQPTPNSIEDVIAEAARSCTPLAVQSGVEIERVVSSPLAPLLMDRDRLMQAFQNLIENALQHAPRGSRVRIEVRPLAAGNQNLVECFVKDAGPGFRPEDLPRIFDPFFSRRRGGTGLGLSIVRRIVEEHDGQIAAGNSPEGGAIITIKLPCLPS
jgi:PAS domain S-box-containing protein